MKIISFHIQQLLLSDLLTCERTLYKVAATLAHLLVATKVRASLLVNRLH